MGGSGRVWGERRMARLAEMSTVWFAKVTSVLRAHQGTESKCSDCFVGCTNKLPCQVQNMDKPQASRIGAHGAVLGQNREGLFANRIVCLGNNPASQSQKHRRHKQCNSFLNQGCPEQPIEIQKQPFDNRFLTGLSLFDKQGPQAFVVSGC